MIVIFQNSEKVTRKDMGHIAYKIFSQFPKSFSDKLGETIVGNGYGLLTDELYNR